MSLELKFPSPASRRRMSDAMGGGGRDASPVEIPRRESAVSGGPSVRQGPRDRAAFGKV